MLNKHFAVLLAGKRYSPEFQKEAQYAAGWKRVLETAYGSTYAVCQCPGKGARKLSIKRRDDTDNFHLARFRDSGPEHAMECRFYSPAPERSGLQGYSKGVVEEREDGSLRIKLARGLRIQAASGKPRTSVRQATLSAPGERKPAMTLLGLLHLLWSESRLNIWFPAMEGKRSPGLIYSKLRETANRIAANQVPLEKVLLLAAQKDSKEAIKNKQLAELAAVKGYRLVAISPLARYDAERHSQELTRLPLVGPFGMPSLTLEPTDWTRAVKRFRHEISAWKRGARVMAIAQLSVTSGAAPLQGQVLELALMQVTDRWIPVDSSYESLIEERLHAAQRSFEKPLRYDASKFEYFPDFWLLDMGKHYPIEVFGMASEGYLEHKVSKSQWYDRLYGSQGWWSWDAAADASNDNVPELPVKPMNN
ncbi:DUF1173 family protein (plasmid) [Pseudomonas luteola]|uniref:DUF1173 family protein n=1 Tax=Pseudomonas luteola TaxID=47886 RepID=UPI00389058D2